MVDNISNQEKQLHDIDRLFELQKRSQFRIARSTAKERILKLKNLKEAIAVTYNEEIKRAVYQDLRKHPTEVELNEIVPVIGAINHTVRYLHKWMRNKKVPTPINLFGFSHQIQYEPKGVVLIISPWNFPLNLALIPLVSAIAAGNAVILKPSEVSSQTSTVINKIVSSLFKDDEVAVIEGGIPTTSHLLKQPFNHIFFTGAPSVGKIVMKAAALNLTSVSLELGGKSPTIVDSTANIEKAAARIAWSKNLNNGQICIAPDYVLVHRSVKEKFLVAYREQVIKLFGEDPKQSDSYGRIINGRHFQRLKNYLEDAENKNGTIELGGTMDAAENYIEPTLISNLKEDALLWQEEIFGPILPIKAFDQLDDVIHEINKGEKPLALYIYSSNKDNIKKVISATRSGAAVVNYSATHYVNPYLPFGGSNNSGIGKANGFHGFKAFSNEKGIQKHWSPFDTIKLFYPPYTSRKDQLVKWVSKWLA